MSKGTKQKFEGGATRSAKLQRYDLIPGDGDTASATRFGIGALIHGEGNWKAGGKDFIKAVINHLKGHVAALLTGDDTHRKFMHPNVPEDARDWDTDAIRCNADMLCWFRAHKPEEYQQALLELRCGDWR
jgi:hypothetical protein